MKQILADCTYVSTLRFYRNFLVLESANMSASLRLLMRLSAMASWLATRLMRRIAS